MVVTLEAEQGLLPPVGEQTGMYAVLLGPLAVALLEPTVPQQRRSLFVAQHRPAVRRLDVPLLLAHGMDHGRGHAECRTGEVEEGRSEEHTSELQSLMSTPYAVFCLK